MRRSPVLRKSWQTI